MARGKRSPGKGKGRRNTPAKSVDTSAVSSTPAGSNAGQRPEQQYQPNRAQSHGSSPAHTDQPSPGSEQNTLAGSGHPTPTSPGDRNSPFQPNQRKDYLSVPTNHSSGSHHDDHPDDSGSTYDADTAVGSVRGDDASSRRGSQDPKKGKGALGGGDGHGESDDAERIIACQDALEPSGGHEADFEVEDNKFAFSPGQLSKLFNPKNLAAFYHLGGLAGLEKGLRTDKDAGLSVDEAELEGRVSFSEATGRAGSDSGGNQTSTPRRRPTSGSQRSPGPFSDRKSVFSDNRLPQRKVRSFWELAWAAYNDKVLILLTVAAVISLSLGIYQAATAKGDEPRVQWVEGFAIVMAIVIVVVVGAANDYQKELQFAKLNKKKEDRVVTVIRSGNTCEISVHDLLVGDVVQLNPGDIIPVDGIYIDGHGVKCDESSATGESDIIYKTPAEEVYQAIKDRNSLRKLDPFILSGGKVAEGVGKFLVTATGTKSTYGRMLMSLQDEAQTTPLQSKLNVLADQIAKIGLTSGLVLFIALFIKFLVTLSTMETAAEKGQAFLKIFIVSVTIVVVAVPEGLPLAVTLALAFATTRMMKDNNLVRLLRACETMGNATTICSDKTGTLTQNEMTIVRGTIGTSARFGKSSDTERYRDEPEPSDEHAGEIPAKQCVAGLSGDVKHLLFDSIVFNSTAFENKDERGQQVFIGSKTECALLKFAREHLGLSVGTLAEARSNGDIAQMVPFDSKRKCMAVVIKVDASKYRLLVKGASEIVASHCTMALQEPKSGLEVTSLTDEKRGYIASIQKSYAAGSLRAISLAYRDFEQWPPQDAPRAKDNKDDVDFDSVFSDLTLVGIVGIQDPLRPGVAEAVKTCQKAGVMVRMVTGDNVLTAKAIASECNIFSAGGIAMEGPEFRKLNKDQMAQIVPRLQVLARSSPDDKKTLVSTLKSLGETVAVTGDGTNDAPALKMADVGFSMGIAGTEVAKEASAIILMDDNFTSIVKAMAWGRTVNDAVRKFLQFQITVNLTATVLTFVSAITSGDESSILTAVQLLWINLIMDTFAALALATDPPNPTMLERKPDPKSAALISPTMWKMIVGESVYQLAISLALTFAGERLLGFSKDQEFEFKTVVFNVFVFMQIFNQYNCRRIDNKLNIFEGLWKNLWFLGIQFVIVGGQIIIVFFGGRAFSVARISASAWGISILLGFMSVPVGMLIRFIPDSFVAKIGDLITRRPSKPDVFITDEEDNRRFQWNPALEEIRDELIFLKKIRGGRLKSLARDLRHPQEYFQRASSLELYSDEQPPSPAGQASSTSRSSSPGRPTRSGGDGGSSSADERASLLSRASRDRSRSPFGPATVMAGVVAGSVAGWSPIERRPSSHALQRDSSFGADTTTGAEGHARLARDAGIELHPATKDDDPIISDVQYIRQSATTQPPSQNPQLAPHLIYATDPPVMPPGVHGRGHRSPSPR
ncbi:hypothetical protein KEM52_003099 [Ascosphaera acerosa]|nr:hypothetical protein KEM52_003099 [Ascosphaera acerosa]